MPAPFDRRLLSQAVTEHRQERHGSDSAVPEDGARGGRHLGGPRRGRIRNISSSPSPITAKGFPTEGRQRLLEPYMTTREGGTGLGLPIVAKILEDHGGRHGACRQSSRSRRTGSHVDTEDEADCIGRGGRLLLKSMRAG